MENPEARAMNVHQSGIATATMRTRRNRRTGNTARIQSGGRLACV
jgi:hypothetical protein